MKFTECPELDDDLGCTCFCEKDKTNFVCCFFCEDFSTCEFKVECGILTEVLLGD